MVKIRKSGKLKKGAAASPNAGLLAATNVMTVAEKWRNRTTPDVKEDEDSSEKREDYAGTFSIDPNVLKTVKYQKEKKTGGVQKEPTVVTYSVRRTEPREKYRNVLVLKPTNSNADHVIPMDQVTNYAGPRFTKDGKFIEHSILGSLDDFTAMARKKGEFQNIYASKKSADDTQVLKKRREESGALKTWNDTIRDRNKMEAYLANKLRRPIGDLLMRTPNVYPALKDARRETLFALEASTLRTNSNNDNKRRSKTQQIRNIKEENKRQQYFGRIKNDRGDYNPMEYRQIPDLILHEMDKGKAIPERSYKPYFTPYLQQQRDRVKDVIHIINPYHPDLADLVVKGEGCNDVSFHDNNKDDLETYKIMDIPPSLSPVCEVSEGNIDLEKPEMEGPALMVGHVKLTWKDRTTSPLIPVSIAFEAHQEYVQTKHISLKNCGSTVLHFYWEPVPMKNPFGLRKRKRQVFYFATEGKTLAPGDEVSIPVIYKSDFPGTFKSIWKLKTTPVLCNGADVLVKLKASTAIQQLSEDRIDSIQKIIEEQQKTCVVEETLNGILRQMYTPPRDLTPVETDRLTEIIPIDVYPGLSRMEQRMKDLYDDICRNDFATHVHLEFSINNLANIICSLDSLETPLPDTPDYQTVLDTMNRRRHTLNAEFYNLTKEISFGTVFPLQNTTIRRMHLSTQILQATVEQFAESSCTIAYRMGIPVLPIQSEECQVENVQFQRKRKQSLAVKPCKKELESKAGASHTQAVSKGAKNKKKGAQSPPKVAPPPPKPEPEVQQVDIFSPVVKEKASTTQLQSFREKLYIQAYGLLQEAIDAMDTFFGEI